MNWVDDTIKKLRGDDSAMNKAVIKEEILAAAKIMLANGFDWDDVEIFMVVQFRPVVGELIPLLAKWIREVRNEERGVQVQ